MIYIEALCVENSVHSCKNYVESVTATCGVKIVVKGPIIKFNTKEGIII